MSSREKRLRLVLGICLIALFYIGMVVAIVTLLPVGKGAACAFAGFLVGGSMWSGWIGYRRRRRGMTPPR